MFTTDGNRKSSQSEVISVPITLEKERHTVKLMLLVLSEF